ncbi:10770_t:CDS:1 [Paraglomus brasilianum]|uniref:10770_t:CDS:1 n=1 Tax=Paraglomus brasilianum TaxID=144538 RepID=A0A9N9GB82_9GLOM|nr:10770_t:CDS:1 [Paraglomus brasilianum]
MVANVSLWRYPMHHRKKTGKKRLKTFTSYFEMIHITKGKRCKQGYKIPREGLCVYGTQCHGYAVDLYEMDYIKLFYVVRSIGTTVICRSDIKKLAFVLRMMWAFRERMSAANKVWDNLESRYETHTPQSSSDDANDYTKATPKKRVKLAANIK